MRAMSGTIKMPAPGTPVLEKPMIRAAIAPKRYCSGSKYTAEYGRCVKKTAFQADDPAWNELYRPDPRLFGLPRPVAKLQGLPAL